MLFLSIIIMLICKYSVLAPLVMWFPWRLLFPNYYCVFLPANKFSQAVDLYDQAIELNSSNAVYWANRAFAHTKLEEYGSAVQDATKAIEIDPKYSKVSIQVLLMAYFCRFLPLAKLCTYRVIIDEEQHILLWENSRKPWKIFSRYVSDGSTNQLNNMTAGYCCSFVSDSILDYVYFFWTRRSHKTLAYAETK
jgi:tetratricopeptide (TPR) repeat protein